ncbi:ABC transporter substrate-binding protein [Isoptericola sp. b490]|uniref:ABC transporter substrate-binding protein n=1 Tax=Actinotalea lenta TaxID=3064654 RepID=UPI0027126D9D|nr:ABC transporter substrate-binding protein [Isoptericola sp. b490]MDO8119765.1 ABC transporter substrate-binding protein [Isoptericola sp. b490]
MSTSRRLSSRGWRILTIAGALALALTACSSGDTGDTPGSSSSSNGAGGDQSSSAPSGDAIKIGILTTCGGPFASFEAESFSGAKYALIKYAGAKADGQQPQDTVSGASISGVSIEVSYGCSDATPDKAVSEARRLVESVGVSVLLGPLSGDEGVAVANYAKSVPGVTFVNGTSGAQSTTLEVDAPNFFRFGGDGAQWMAGLASYAHDKLGWSRVAILGEDYSYPYTLAAGFVKEFCSLGGEIASRSWVPLDQTDWSSPVAQLPRDVDGVLLLTGGTNTIAAEKAYIQLGQNPGKTMLGGSSVMDPTSFTVGKDLVGLTGGSPVPLGGTSPEWTQYVDGIKAEFPDVPADSLFTVLYYDGMQAILQALDQVGADLSDNQAAFREALTSLDPTFPNGSVTLDENRNSIQPAYVVKIVDKDGSLGFEVVKSIKSVDETFGGLFSASDPAPDRNNPACEAGTPPPWDQG